MKKKFENELSTPCYFQNYNKKPTPWIPWYVGCHSLLQTEFHCLFNNDPYQLHSRESVCIQKDTIYDTRLVDRSIFISITIAAGFFAKFRNSMTLPFDLLSELALLNFGLKHIIQCVFSQGKSAIDHRHAEFQSNLN